MIQQGPQIVFEGGMVKPIGWSDDTEIALTNSGTPLINFD